MPDCASLGRGAVGVASLHGVADALHLKLEGHHVMGGYTLPAATDDASCLNDSNNAPAARALRTA